MIYLFYLPRTFAVSALPGKGSLSLNTLLLVLSLMLLTACGTTNDKPSTTPLEVHEMAIDQLKIYIDQTQALVEPERSERSLKALDRLIVLNEVDFAHALADAIDVAALNNNQFVSLMLFKGKIARKEGEPFYAHRYLFLEEVEEKLIDTDIEVKKSLYDLRATLLYDLSEYMKSVEQRLLLSPLLADDELSAQLNHDLIWEALANIPTDTLYDIAKVEKDTIKQGWYSLAALSKNNGADFRSQLRDIEQWRANWEAHPANQMLPADLQLIVQLADTQASRVAVMLPLSGRLAAAGKAVRDGMMSAYYDDLSKGIFSPTLRFYDTHDQDVNILYDIASDDGAELVIGPLSKAGVTELSQREHFPVKTLALNTVSIDASTKEAVEEGYDMLDAIEGDAEGNDADESSSTSSDEDDFRLAGNDTAVDEYEPSADDVDESEGALLIDDFRPAEQTLFQFGLSIEHEAQSVAEKAWRDGHRSVLILAPSTLWGERGSQSFKSHWEELGGVIVDERRFDRQKEYSKLVEASVSVNVSKQRHRNIERLLGTNLQFEPRRRKDIDFIFMLAHSTQAQQLKPLLAFHYAGKIPIYATSQVYSGSSEKALNDLNGIRFATMPWFFDATLSERRAIDAYGNIKDRYQTLYALGVDAYHIYPRLDQLKTIPQARYYGSTGKLHINENNEIMREQTWAEIIGGKASELGAAREALNE